MKHLLLFLAIILTACSADVTVDTPIHEARAVFAALHNARAPNVGVTDKGVTAYYLDSDAEFCLYFNQCATLAYDGRVQQFDCAVYQTAVGVWVADFRNGEFVKVNTMTGTTTLYFGGMNRVYRKNPTP